VGMSPLLLLAVEARAAEWGAQLGAGAAFGGYSCISDFDGLERYHWGASPFAFAAGEVGRAPVYVFLGVDSAPTFRYGGGACHVTLATYAMATAGSGVAPRSSGWDPTPPSARQCGGGHQGRGHPLVGAERGAQGRGDTYRLAARQCVAGVGGLHRRLALSVTERRAGQLSPLLGPECAGIDGQARRLTA
jgi:hypothetical protein